MDSSMTSTSTAELLAWRRCQTIAVLDDDPSFREALTAALMSLGYIVLAFSEPQSLLSALGEMMPTCILLDFNIPKMSGLDVFRALSARAPDIPTIFVTANQGVKIRSRIEALRPAGLIYKPINIDELDALILRSSSGSLQPPF